MAELLQLSVRHDFTRGGLLFRQLARREVPYVRAVSLTRLAQAARDEHRALVARRFKVRNRRVLTSTAITPARRADFPREFSVVGVRDGWLAQHEVAGWKLPAPGRKSVAVKARLLPRTGTGRVPRALKPHELLNTPGSPYFLNPKTGYLQSRSADEPGPGGRRSGRRRRKQPSPEQLAVEALAQRLRAFYYFKPRTRLKARLGLLETARRVLATRTARIVERELARATRKLRHEILRPL